MQTPAEPGAIDPLRYFTILDGMPIYDIEVTTINGEPQRLEIYRGQVLLIVNVASQCGFTPQYAGLEALYRKFRDQGFTVLGFPCNQFGHQERGDEIEIKNFCQLKYEVTFPLFAKLNVNGPNAHPLYDFLKTARPGLLGTRRIKWNFTKFLVDREGNVVRRFGPSFKPERLEARIKQLLLGEDHD
jgi:glutathione peroxidase